MEQGYKRWLYPLIELVVHVWVGTVLFALVFAPAVGLEFAIQSLEGKISDTLMGVLKATKVAAVVIDAALYVVFLIYTGTFFVRELLGYEPIQTIDPPARGADHG